MNSEELQTILNKLQAGYQIYHRHQEQELNIEYVGEGRFVVTESEFMGECRSQDLNAKALSAYLFARFSSLTAVERLLQAHKNDV